MEIQEAVKQLMTATDHVANVVSTYHMQLLQKGLSEELASDMTRDFSMMLWSQITSAKIMPEEHMPRTIRGS